MRQVVAAIVHRWPQLRVPLRRSQLRPAHALLTHSAWRR
jgi:hypothetical protein